MRFWNVVQVWSFEKKMIDNDSFFLLELVSFVSFISYDKHLRNCERWWDVIGKLYDLWHKWSLVVIIFRKLSNKGGISFNMWTKWLPSMILFLNYSMFDKIKKMSHSIRIKCQLYKCCFCEIWIILLKFLLIKLLLKNEKTISFKQPLMW